MSTTYRVRVLLSAEFLFPEVKATSRDHAELMVTKILDRVSTKDEWLQFQVDEVIDEG